ncbi:AAA family ATPase [Acetobacterium wieringae]|uniref:AAA family ATPase n=1 Tax=Acetobacterium wieringae TaxID=52694 RepID=UPI0026ED5A45|nr:AAA family ATPase [Acetobacterium wieringae]
MQEQKHDFHRQSSQGLPIFENQLFKSIRNGEQELSKDKLVTILRLFIEMTVAIEESHKKNQILASLTPDMFMATPDFDRDTTINVQVSKEVAITTKEYPDLYWLTYISPEQTGRMGRIIDYRSNYYSLGVIMYELITGQKPFMADSILGMMHCHIAKNPVAPVYINPDIPKAISNIIMKLMEKEPKRRYQSTSGIISDLKRCMEAIRFGGGVIDFELARDDWSNKFQIPQKLYGREKERKTVQQLYEQVSVRGSQILLVGGCAGVGKTAMVQEIFQSTIEPGVFFVSGKAEQLQVNTPYFVFTQIIRELIRLLLQESDLMLEQWKKHLLEALNNNGQLIIDLVPELRLIIGEQDEIKELEPTESRNRFLTTLGNFFKLFARKEQPLAVFLDDFQWCDQASLELVNYLLTFGEGESLMIVIGYRDNEIQGDHSLSCSLGELQKLDRVSTMIVKPLDQKYVAQIIADTVHCNQEKGDVLAGIVFRKTQGNPFFVRSLLLHLYTDHYIYYDTDKHQWEWDEGEIQKITISDNSVDFMIGQILKLPLPTQGLLKVGALIGTTFDLTLLMTVQNMNEEAILDHLKEAVDREIIIPVYNYYELKLTDDKRVFRFAHDRIQQACEALTPLEIKKQLHLKIANSIRQNLSADQVKDQAIQIVCHLNEGLDLITEREERLMVLQLNLWASQKAKAATSFQLARQYIEKAMSFLPDNSWSQDYQLTFEIIKTCAECAYLNKEYKVAEAQIEILMKYAKTAIDLAEIRLMQSVLYRYLGQLDQVIYYGVLGLRLLGIRLPFEPSLPLVIKELMLAKARLQGKSTEQFLHAAPLQNDKVKLIIRIMSELTSVTYNGGNVNLFLFSTLKSLNLTLKYGNSQEAASIYSGYAVLLAVLGDLKGSYQFHKLALKLVETEERAKYRASVLFAYGFLGYAWSESFQDVDYWFKKAMKAALQYGDHYQVVLAGTFMYAFKADMDLKLLTQKAMEQVPLIRQTNNQYGYSMSFLFINRWLNYLDLTEHQFSMDVSPQTHEQNGGMGIIGSEEQCLKTLWETNSLSAIGVYYKEKMYIHYLYDDYTKALDYLAESDKYLKYHAGTPYVVECRVCNFLVLAANLAGMKREASRKTLKRLKQEYKYVKSWSSYCPDNFLHLQLLLEAELARIEGKIDKALEYYEVAAETAARNGFLRDEALTNELAAKMFLGQGRNRQAAFFMSEAFQGYQRWGAAAKVRQLAEKYDGLLKLPGNDLSTVETVAGQNIDLIAVISAYQAVAKEVQLPDLLRKIMKIVVENSGAQKAYLLLKNEPGWNIEAAFFAGEDDIKVLQSVNLKEAEELIPQAVINFCIHTGEVVVLSDAARQGAFQQDAYIQKNQTKSLIAMPIKNQGVITGILYLENNLAKAIFTDSQVEILQLLTAQFSISIRNVQLFSNLIATKEELHRSTEELLRSEIAFLQAQIKPHFLYNALNTIAAFSLDEPQMTRDLLANLSAFLRGSFDFKNRDKLVTLQKELELVEAYLFIEKARFGKRLNIIYDIEDQIICLLPPLVIQPLVENAVQHGLAAQKNGGTVKISVHHIEESIIISVVDDGVGIPEEVLEKCQNGSEGSGVALKNINMRLVRLYGHGLEVERMPGGGTRAVIQIPMTRMAQSS